jgi:hypothetical protein
MKNIKLTDYIRIKKDSTLDELEDKQVCVLKDSKNKPKALIVTFDLSGSGKVINNRIYPPWAQEQSCPSWIEPYRKPILMHHDKDTDPLGRFVEVRYQNLEAEALDYLGDVNKYLEVKRAFDSKRPKKIYDAMKKYHLLTDRKWPGLGKLVADAKITDPDAIEKFLDERYLTFSAGQGTDSYTCMICDSDWMKGDICEHRPGTVNEDGDLAIFLTGACKGKEGSVVNMPAHTSSQVSNLKFEDSESESIFGDNPQWMLNDSDEEFFLTDASVSVIMEKNTPDFDKLISDLQELQPSTAIRAIVNGLVGDELYDALTGTTHYETTWLIRIHDALHHEYEWNLRYSDEEETKTIPTAVFKLHGTLHDLSDSKDFRDSLINGPLDKYSATGEENNAYVLQENNMNTKDTENPVEDEVVDTPEVVEELPVEDSADEAAVEETPETEVKDEVVVKDSEPVVEDAKEEVVDEVKEEPDWFMLDLALHGLVADDAKLSVEDRDKLDSSVFCGPDKSFPVHDSAHYTAAKELIGRYNGPGKSEIMDSIESKGKELSKCNCNEKYDELKQDYVRALNQNDSLETKLTMVLDKLAKQCNKEFIIEDNKQKLDLMITWFDNMEMNETSDTDKKTQEVEDKETKEEEKEVIDMTIDNPSLVNSENQDEKKTDEQRLEGLSRFDMNVLTKYKDFCDKENQEVADIYFRQMLRYVSKPFDPAKLAKLIN